MTSTKLLEAETLVISALFVAAKMVNGRNVKIDVAPSVLDAPRTSVDIGSVYTDSLGEARLSVQGGGGERQ